MTQRFERKSHGGFLGVHKVARPVPLAALCVPAILALFLTFLGDWLGWFVPVDRFVHDLSAAATRHTVTSNLTIVEIDAASLHRLQTWPWPRGEHAHLLDRLREAGAASVFYDVDFGSPSSLDDDALLAAALARYPRDSVMLPTFVQPRSQSGADALIEAQPIEAFAANTVTVSVNVRPDADGRIRRIAGYEYVNNELIPLAGLRMGGQTRTPPETVRIDYSIDPLSFIRLSFADVLAGRFAPAAVRGRQVIVGATATELGDLLPVPVYHSLPGAVVQALAYQTLRQGGLQPVASEFEIGLTLVLFVLMSWAFTRDSWRLGLVFVAGSLAAILGAAILAYREWHWLLAIGPQIGFLVSGYAFFLIARLEQQRHTLQFQAMHDALTGLGNRYSLDRVTRDLLAARRADESIGLLLIDLDKFREINDTLGHRVGDRVLEQVARRFAACIENGKVLARIGGDEFAVLVRDTPNAENSRQLAECLLQALKQPLVINGIALEVGASIGIALHPEHAGEPALLLQNADSAMYAAKRAGIGVSLYEPEFARRNMLRLGISTGLRKAIAEDRLHLHYQPKLEVASNTVRSAEALLRWTHPKLGELSPEVVVEVAENTGLIWPLTEWTLKRALTDLRGWRAGGRCMRVSVNLSARLLQDRVLVDRITDCLAHGRFDPRLLTLEITERAIMADPEAALRNAMALKAAGIELSIDDFGTGYSSLDYLKNLPASELKIDKSFVIDMMHKRRDALIVKSTVELAHNLGLRVVAEGVESAAILAAVRNMGCDHAQGYHIGRPAASGDWPSELPEAPALSIVTASGR